MCKSAPAVLTLTPATAISINTLAYPPIHTAYIADTETPVLLILPTPSPSPSFLFLFPEPGSITHMTYAPSTNSLTLNAPAFKPSPPGTRGVLLQTDSPFPALGGFIARATLIRAGISAGVCAHDAVFPPLPALSAGRTGRELTDFHLDRTEYVKLLIGERYDGEYVMLLGELQLAFLAFAVLGVAEGLDVWTRLVREVCNADRLRAWEQALWEGFVGVVKAQFGFLRQCGGEEVSVIVDELRGEFTRFLGNCPADGLRKVLTSCGWVADEEDEPVVVDFDVSSGS